MTFIFLLGSIQPQFADPVVKGAPTPNDELVIPPAYWGEWQEDLKSCGTAETVMIDRGSGLIIGRHHIAGLPVLSIESYSNHPAIVVSIGTDDFPEQRIDLDLARDENWISIGRNEDGNFHLLQRCPRGSIVEGDMP